jgi:phosphate transport system substrate-binding protein
MRLKWNLAAVTVCALLAGCMCTGCTGCGGMKVKGAGATFPEPLYQVWIKDFNDSHPGIQLSYSGVGSGQGKKNVIDGTVDFGGSDAAMKKDEMDKVDKGVVLLPMTAGAIVLIYNLKDIDELKLPRDVYSDIFLGKITKWNDDKIKEANPKIADKLPDAKITVVVRGDKSGTTFVFSNHLSAINQEFKKKVGAHEKPQWPTSPIEGQGTSGVTQQVQQNPNAIGYVEFGYAEKSGKPMALLQNRAGNYVKCTPETAQNTLKVIDLPEDLIKWEGNPEGEDVYPIVTFTWMIFYKSYSDEKKYNAIKEFIHYGLHEGQAKSVELGYVRLPDAVIAKCEKAAEQIKLAK